MNFRELKFVIFLLLISYGSAKRFSSGSRSSSSRSWGGSRSRPSSTHVSAPTSFHVPSAPSHSTSFHTPSAPSHSTSFHTPSAPSHSTSFHTPSAPSHSTNIHNPSSPSRSNGFNNPSAPSSSSNHASTSPHHGSSGFIVNEKHQQSSAPNSHSSPYDRQPSQNPYVPSGGYGSHGSNIPAAPHGVSVPTIGNGHHTPPYPTNLPNHPHPSPGITSSSIPTNSHVPNFGTNGAVHTPSHSSYHPTVNNAPPPYHPNYGGSPPPYHPSYNSPPPYSPYGGSPPAYHPGYSPSHPTYHPPAYQPPTAPFVPGRTVYVIPESRSHSSGSSGIGSAIATGVAGGVAAGATNAIVDHAISSIFRPSHNHVHTYPSAPPVGTSTSVTTNNYYYGQPNGQSNTQANNQPNGQVDQSVSNNQPSIQPAQTGQPQSQNIPVRDNSQPSTGATAAATNGAPSSTTNGQVTNNPNPGQNEVANTNIISDESLMRFTEELFDKQDTNVNQHVELNLQKRLSGNNQGTVADEAPEPLFVIKPELDRVPVVATLKTLYDNYKRDGKEQEEHTSERRNEENAFLDEIIKTPVMSRALNWLVEQKYIESDSFEQKDLLKRMWFTTFEGTSSGFERIFLSEKFGDSGIVGMQNWIYFAHLEAQKNANYLGYVESLSLSGKGSLLKLSYQTEGFTIQNATIFVGTSPELELALYTICFHARPNNWCPISLGGAKFFILTHSFRYYGKDLIDLGFPAF